MSLSSDTTGWWNSATVSGSSSSPPFESRSYSLAPDLASISRAAIDRYIQFLSSIDDPTPGLKALSKISEPVEERDRHYRGFNLFDGDDQSLFEVLCRGEFLIHGFRNRSPRQHLKQFRPSQISRLLKRLRLHGIIKTVGNTYKYHLTQLGRSPCRQRRTHPHEHVPRSRVRHCRHHLLIQRFWLFCNQSSGERTTSGFRSAMR